MSRQKVKNAESARLTKNARARRAYRSAINARLKAQRKQMRGWEARKPKHVRHHLRRITNYASIEWPPEFVEAKRFELLIRRELRRIEERKPPESHHERRLQELRGLQPFTQQEWLQMHELVLKLEEAVREH